MKPVEDLIRIAHAGGGLDLRQSALSTDDLVRIAHAASAKGARVKISGANRPTDDLIRIAHAGKGAVEFIV